MFGKRLNWTKQIAIESQHFIVQDNIKDTFYCGDYSIFSFFNKVIAKFEEDLI